MKVRNKTRYPIEWNGVIIEPFQHIDVARWIARQLVQANPDGLELVESQDRMIDTSRRSSNG